MNISLYPPMLPTRPCRFCLCLELGCVFADFEVDPDGRIYCLRISFDGYGACRLPADVGRMNAADSALLLDMVQRDSLDASIAARVLRTYFNENRRFVWEDALAQYGLLPAN